MITFNYLMAQALIVLNAKLKKENTAKRVGGLIRDLLLYIQNIILGIILKGEKENEAAIKAISNPTRGDTYKSLDTGHYWCYDGTQWNDIGELIPSNLVTKDELSQLENKVFNSDSKLNAIIDSDTVEISLGTTTGALLKSGLVSTSAMAYIRTTVTNAAGMLSLEKGVVYTYTGEIDNVNYAGVCYYDSSLNPLGYQFEIGNYADEPLAHPDGATYAGVCGKGGFTVKRTTSFLKLSQEEGFGSKEAMSQDAISRAIRQAIGYSANKKVSFPVTVPVVSGQVIYNFPLKAGIVYKLTLSVDTTATANFRGHKVDIVTTLGSFGTVTNILTTIVIFPTIDYDFCSVYFGSASVATQAFLSIEEPESEPEAIGLAKNLFPDPFCHLKGAWGSSVGSTVVVGTIDYSEDGKIRIPSGAFLGLNFLQDAVGVVTGTDYLNAMFLGYKPTGATIAIRVDHNTAGNFGPTYSLTTDIRYTDWLSLLNSKSNGASLSGRFQIMFDNRSGTEDLIIQRFYLWKGQGVSVSGLFTKETQEAVYKFNSGDWNKDFVKSGELFEGQNTELTWGTTSGAILKTGTVTGSGTASDYKRMSVTNTSVMLLLDPLKKYYYSGEIDNSTYCGVLYKNAAMAVVGYDCGDAMVYDKELLKPPSTAAFAAMCGKEGFTLVQESRVVSPSLLPSELTGSVVRYVDGSIAASGDGSYSQPFKTIAEAIEYVADKSKGWIVVSEGDYRETLPLAKLKTGEFTILPRDFAKGFRVLGSDKLVGWSKTPGQTNVYELPFTGTLPNFPRMGGTIIFEDGKPSKEIESRHYHPLQKNLTHRLPFTALVMKMSIAEVDAQAGTHYYDTTNGKLYVHTSESNNPETNSYSYEVNVRSFNTYVAPATQKERVRLDIVKATFMYSTAFIARGFDRMTRRFCVALGCTSAGAWMNDSGFIETFYEEAGFCNNDGENSHFSAYNGYGSLSNNRAMSPTVRHDCLWTHDNGDDGESSHELHNVFMTNSLFEFNGDSGSRPSNDATYYVTNSIFRNNGWEVTINGTNTAPSRGGEGFSVVNPVSANPNRKGCRAVLIGCVFEENNVGLAAISQADNYVEAIDCISRNNNTEIYAAAGAKVVVRNHKATNSDPNKIKVTATGGTIEVYNDELVEN